MKLNLQKVEGKTRIIKKFIWFKKLGDQRRYLDFYYVLQRCVKCDTSGIANYEWQKSTSLEWVDEKWAEKQTLFLRCKCGNELTSTGSFVSDTEDGVKYECTDCFRTSIWNFDLFPIPVEITDGKYPSPKEMKKAS
jgi:hypothetical protein